MAHPKVTKRLRGKLWHLEDSGLSLPAARALKSHLKNTEDKHSRITKGEKGHDVWWSK